MASSLSIPREALGPDDVHVWRLLADEVAEPALLRRIEALLSPEETERYLGFGHERTRREFLLARGMARTVLASYLPAFFIAGALCVVAALIVLSISRAPKLVVA